MNKTLNLDLSSFEAFQKQKATFIPSQFTRPSFFENSIDELVINIELKKDDIKLLCVIFDVLMDLMLALDEGTKAFNTVKNYERLLFALIQQSESTSLPCRKNAQNCFKNFLKLFDYEAQSQLIIYLFEQIYNRNLKVNMEPQVLAFLCDLYRQKLNESEELKQIFGSHLCEIYAQIQRFKFPDLMQANHFYSSILLLISLHARTQFDLVLLKNTAQKLFDEINILVRDFIQLMELRNKNQNLNEQNFHETFPLEILKMHIVETSRCLKTAK